MLGLRGTDVRIFSMGTVMLDGGPNGATDGPVVDGKDQAVPDENAPALWQDRCGQLAPQPGRSESPCRTGVGRCLRGRRGGGSGRGQPPGPGLRWDRQP